MKLKGAAITILFNDDGLKIEIEDRSSGLTFARIKLNQKETCQALSRLSYTNCECEVYNLNKVNKKMILKPFEFKLPEGVDYYNRITLARKTVLELCPEGWEPDLGFGSQGSFFTKDKESWATTIIRSYIDIEEGAKEDE